MKRLALIGTAMVLAAVAMAPAPLARASWNPSVSWTHVVSGDFTGDGRADIAGFDPGTGDWWVETSTGGAFTTSLWGVWSPSVTWSDVVVGDFNGDGKADIAGRDQSTGTWWVALSTGSGFTSNAWAVWSPSATWGDVHVADFNGDGKADIAGRDQSTGDWYVALSTGSSFTTNLWAAWNPSVTWVDVNTGDFNGDGKADIAGRDQSTGDWYVALSTGSAFTTSLWAVWNPSVSWSDIVVGDFNGDGKTDIAGRDPSSGTWWVALSTGSSFTSDAWAVWSPSVSWSHVVVGDFNGDGKADIAGRDPSSGTWWVALSTGSSFSSTAWAVWSTSVTWADVHVGDFNGDGWADIAGRDLANAQWYVATSHGTGFTTGPWDQPQRLTLSPSSGPPTGRVMAMGSRYPANDAVTISFDGASVAGGTSGASGTFSIGFAVPQSAAPGTHTVGAFDAEGLGFSATFTVQTSWVSARFDQAGSGFNPYENVLGPSSLGNLHQLSAPQWSAYLHSEPVYYNGILYAGSSDGTARAFDPLSGDQRWSFAAGGAVDGSPAVVVPKAGHAACAVVVASTNGTVYGLDPSRGTELWNVNLGGGPISGSPTLVASGTQQVGQNVIVVTDNGTVALLQACTGTIGYEVVVDYLEGDPDTPIVLNHVPLSDGTVHTVVVVSSGAGTLALDEPTGHLLWNVSVPCGSPPCSPAGFGSGKGARIVLGSGSSSGRSSLDLLNAGTGAIVWSAQMPAPVSGIGLFETPVPGSGNRFSVQSIIAADVNGDVESFNPRTGAINWGDKQPGAGSTPAIANGVIYLTSGPTSGPAGSSDGQLLAVDGSGNALFSADTGDLNPQPYPPAPPTVADGRVYVGDFTGGLRVLGLTSG